MNTYENQCFQKQNLRYSDKDATAIETHCHQHSHSASLNTFSVADNAAKNYHLLFKESLLIFKLKPSLNAAETMLLFLFQNDS